MAARGGTRSDRQSFPLVGNRCGNGAVSAQTGKRCTDLLAQHPDLPTQTCTGCTGPADITRRPAINPVERFSMKFVGKADGPHTIICRLFDDETVAEVAEATEFYSDLPESISAAAELAGGTRSRAEIAEVPALRPSARVLCVGLNYRLHAVEAGLPIPEYPAFFGRWTPSLVAGDTPVPVRYGEPGLDWEVELAVVVSRPLHRVDAPLRWAASSGTPRSTICPRESTTCIRGSGLSARTPIGADPSRRSSPPTRSATPPTNSDWCPGSTAT